MFAAFALSAEFAFVNLRPVVEKLYDMSAVPAFNPYTVFGGLVVVFAFRERNER